MIQKALANAEGEGYRLSEPREAPVLGPHKAKIDALLKESQTLPRKQRYTAHKIYELIYADGYRGSESGVHVYVWRKRSEGKRPAVYVPLEFEPGKDAQVDWGEAVVEMNGERVTVQFFEMRLCYSRKAFVRVYPNQRQEAFFDGHVEGFKFFNGVPHKISYDNLKAAVQQVLHGRTRKEQRTFVAFRSHYLFEARFCTPGEGHEKGGVENGIGYTQRNLFSPLVQADSFEDLNAQLLALCQQEEARTVRGQPVCIGEAFAQERAALLPLAERHFACCATAEATLNGYSQVVFETNRYSVPVKQARTHLTVRAYPFRMEILDGEHILATHARC